ncbi:MAG: ATP-binding protein [Nanoarchaeota archaeon]
MELNKLAEANPWWSTKKVPEELKGLPRLDYALLVKSIDVQEVTIIVGVRRAGKSTFMYQMVEKLLEKGVQPEQILFINFEDTRFDEDSLEDIYQLYRTNLNPDKKAYIFFDEIHKKEKWEAWIRRHYDLKTNCKFVVSGSCSYLLKKEYATLLTGRNLTFEVYPLSFKEFLGFKKLELDISKAVKGLLTEKEKFLLLNSFEEYLSQGGFPRVLFQEKEFKTKLLDQYYNDILFKDIINRYNLNSQKTSDFAKYIMTNVTSLISLRNVRNVLGLSYESIKDYLSHAHDAFLFFTLDHFSYSMKEQKSRAPKVYCVDNGLRNAVSFKFIKDNGRLAENLAFIELKRKNYDIYYWKSTNEKEVDFVIKKDNQTLTAINVTYTDEIPEREITSLMEFKKEFSKAKELIILTKNLEKKEKGINYIPLWKWLLEND